MTLLGGVSQMGHTMRVLSTAMTSRVFDTNLVDLRGKWDQREQNVFHDHKSHEPEFHGWFTRWKADDFRHCTLRPLREDVGLGSPPAAFYTNDSESINALLKGSLGYKKHQWGLFNEKAKKIVEQQQREMEKAIVGYGEYRLQPQYSFLAVSEEKWFRMSQERLRWVRKFNAVRTSSEYDVAPMSPSSFSPIVPTPHSSSSATSRSSSSALAPTSHLSSSALAPTSHSSSSATSRSSSSAVVPSADSSLSRNIPAYPVQSSSSEPIQSGAVPTEDINTGRFSLQGGIFLSVPLEKALTDIKLPYTTAEGICR